MPCVFDIREIIKNGNMVDGNIMDFRLREIGGIGVYVELHFGCTMFVVLKDWPVLKFIDAPLSGYIFIKK